MTKSPRKTHLLIWSSVLVLLALNTVSAYSSDLIKVLGRGIQDDYSKNILQLQCVSPQEGTIEPGCETLQAILINEKNEILRVGSPIRQNEESGFTVWDSVIKSTNFIESAREQLEQSWNDLSIIYHPKNIWKLSHQEWKQARAFVDREFDYWQFSPLKIDAETFSDVLISLSRDDSGLNRKTKKGCTIRKVTDLDTEETRRFNTVGFVWTQVRQLFHLKNENWAVLAHQTAPQITPLLRQYYRYVPGDHEGIQDEGSMDVYFQKSKGKDYGDGTSKKCFIIGFFKSGTSELIFKDQVCERGVRSERWSVVADQFPKCERQ